MKRREFITFLGGAAASWPLAARAQQPGMPVVGFLNAGSPEQSSHEVHAFRLGLNEMGYVEGRDLAIEYRWAENRYDHLPALAAELVRRRVSVITTGRNVRAALAAKTATTTIPIVFLIGADPVELGLVTSLNRPGGNLTGVTTLNTEIEPKRLEILRKLLPTARMMAVLVNPGNDPVVVETLLRQAQAAAHTLGLQMIHVLQASTERDLDSAFSILMQRRAEGLAINADMFFYSKSVELAALASRHAVPTISPYREFVTAGGLMSYGGSIKAPRTIAGFGDSASAERTSAGLVPR